MILKQESDFFVQFEDNNFARKIHNPQWEFKPSPRFNAIRDFKFSIKPWVIIIFLKKTGASTQ